MPEPGDVFHMKETRDKNDLYFPMKRTLLHLL